VSRLPASAAACWYARHWGPEPVTLQAFVSLLGIRRFFVDRSEQLPALLDNSLKFQDEVTDALGEQVRRAVEVLIQALDRADVDRNRELLDGIEPGPVEAITEADIRLWVTLARFDAVYHYHFKVNLRRLTDYPNLWGYARDLYSIPAFGGTTDFDQIKRHYYGTHPQLNPLRIVPAVPPPAGLPPWDTLVQLARSRAEDEMRWLAAFRGTTLGSRVVGTHHHAGGTSTIDVEMWGDRSRWRGRFTILVVHGWHGSAKSTCSLPIASEPTNAQKPGVSSRALGRMMSAPSSARSITRIPFAWHSSANRAR